MKKNHIIHGWLILILKKHYLNSNMLFLGFPVDKYIYCLESSIKIKNLSWIWMKQSV